MDSQLYMYIFLGIVYTVLFIVIGTFLVHKKRRADAKEEAAAAANRDI